MNVDVLTIANRLAQWTFFIDSHFNVMFNNRPQIQAFEMIGSLPCSKALFDAATPDEFEQLAAVDLADRRPDSLADFMKSLEQGIWRSSEEQIYQGITVMHLLMVAHGKDRFI